MQKAYPSQVDAYDFACKRDSFYTKKHMNQDLCQLCVDITKAVDKSLNNTLKADEVIDLDELAIRNAAPPLTPDYG